jgi:hypothetical protein
MKSILACGLQLCLIGLITLGAGQERGREEKGAASVDQLIEKKYDRFKDETTVKLKPQKIREIAKPREELSLSVEATYKGDRATRPKEVILVFDSSSEKYIYHSETEVGFIVDGKRIDAGIAHERSNLRRNPHSEETTLKLIIPFDIFAEIANGKNVEMRLRKTEVTFRPSTIAALRAFAKAISGESKGG